MSLQLNIFLLLFGALQGLLLSVFLIKRKLYRNGYIFLLLYFAVMIIQIIFKVMNKTWLMTNMNFLYGVASFLPLLYGPLIFLFVRHLLLNKRFRSADLLHFFPFAFLFIYLWLAGFFSFSNQHVNFFYRTDTGMVMQLISLLVYHVLALRAWLWYKGSLKNYFSETQRLQMNWIRQIIIASFAVCTIIAVAIYLIYITHPRSLGFRYWFGALTIFIYWVSYTALTKPSVFSVIKSYAKKDDAVISLLPQLVVHRPAKKYSNSSLSEEEIIAIKEALQKMMTEQKNYLDPELTINDLAEMIKCTRHNLSRVLNEALKQSFYDYVNQYRVEEAKQLLLDPAKQGYKIAGIAFDAGFNSISTFNDVFRKIAGDTPSQYRKQKAEESKKQRV
jgi:AraC-like DNA-binding protein